MHTYFEFLCLLDELTPLPLWNDFFINLFETPDTGSANIKYSLNPRQININSNTQAYLSITEQYKSSFLQNITSHDKRQENVTIWRAKQSLKTDSEMREMLELSDEECKITMINILSTLIKIEIIQEDTCNASREFVS